MGTDLTLTDISITAIRAKDTRLADIAIDVDNKSKNKDGKINPGYELFNFRSNAMAQGYTDEQFYQILGFDSKDTHELNVAVWDSYKKEFDENIEKGKKDKADKAQHKENPSELKTTDLYDVQQQTLLNKSLTQLFYMMDSIRMKFSKSNNNPKWSQMMREQLENDKQESLRKLQEIEHNYETAKTRYATEKESDKEIELIKAYNKKAIQEEIQQSTLQSFD